MTDIAAARRRIAQATRAQAEAGTQHRKKLMQEAHEAIARFTYDPFARIVSEAALDPKTTDLTDAVKRALEAQQGGPLMKDLIDTARRYVRTRGYGTPGIDLHKLISDLADALEGAGARERAKDEALRDLIDTIDNLLPHADDDTSNRKVKVSEGDLAVIHKTAARAALDQQPVNQEK